MDHGTLGTASPLIIEELFGDKRTLLLSGRALPTAPIAFSGTMRMETTWFPGNPEATVQVFGAAEAPTTIRGEWKDKYIREFTDNGGTQIYTAIAELDQIQVGSASALVAVVDDIRRKGQLVKVSWDDVLRVGILSKFTHTWKRHQDIEWEMEFTWISQGDQASAAMLTGQKDLGELKASWDDLVNTLSLVSPPFALQAQVFDTIAAFTRAIEDLGSQVTDTIASSVQLIRTPLKVAKALMGTFTNLANEADGLQSFVTGFQNAAHMFTAFEDKVESYSEGVTAQAYRRQLEDSTNDIKRKASEHLAQLAKQIEPNLLGTYFAKDGDNLRDVARAYYGTPDDWRDLLEFNQLTSSDLVAGQLVLVPRKAEEAA